MNVKVEWVCEYQFYESSSEYAAVPVVRVEGLMPLLALPHMPECAVFRDLLDGGPLPCSCPKQLLAHLTPKEGTHE